MCQNLDYQLSYFSVTHFFHVRDIIKKQKNAMRSSPGGVHEGPSSLFISENEMSIQKTAQTCALPTLTVTTRDLKISGVTRASDIRANMFSVTPLRLDDTPIFCVKMTQTRGF